VRGRHKTLLLSGFEPFGGERRNPSWEVARLLDGEALAGLRIHSLRLPVDYTRAPRIVAEALANLKPAVVLGLGQAGARPAISLERVAVNLMDGQARDNRRRRMTDRPVAAGAPDAYFARLPLRNIMRALDRQRIPVTLSLSAGSFLCNAVMYTALHVLRHKPSVPCGFIHLPYDTLQAAHHRDAPSLPLDLMVTAVRIAAIQACAALAARDARAKIRRED